MTFEVYRDAVVVRVRKEYSGKICIDTIKEAYNNHYPISEAVENVIVDSMMWNEM